MSKAALSTSNVQLKIHADDWRDALRKGAVPLLNAGNITEQYVANMITAVETLGPYIVIAPGLALGHARPDESVITTGFSIATLDTPVEFGSASNDPVDVVVILASVDETDHLERLRQLSGFLGHKKNLDLLRSATSSDDIHHIVDLINEV